MASRIILNKKGGDMNIKPLFDRVLLEPKESEKETKSGIILPTAAQEKSQVAKVMVVGKGGDMDGHKVEMQVKVGDTVLYAKYSGTEVTSGDKKYVIVRQADILAVLD